MLFSFIPLSRPAGFRLVPWVTRLASVGLVMMAQAGTSYGQAPTLTALSPARNALSAPRSTNVAATFSQPLSSSAATQGALKVFSQQAGGKKAGMATVSGNTLSFDPSIDFKAGETVYATATAAVQSAGGVAAKPHVFQFSTATSPSTGTFSLGVYGTNLSSTVTSIVPGDIDGDGDLDLLAIGGANAVSVRLNNGNGSYASAQDLAVGNNPTGLTVGDWDGDGDLDFATANSGIAPAPNGSVSLGSNQGDYYTVGGVTGYSGVIRSITNGDLDGDGDLDLLVGTAAGVTVLRNNGTGTFTPDSTHPVLSDSGYVVVGDIDNDGDLDLLAGTGAFASVRLNDGTGAFSGNQQIEVSPGFPTLALTLALGDIDKDGDLDLLTSRAQWYRNDGTGTFGASQGVNTSLTAVADARMGDLDGDGDLDLFVVGILTGFAKFTTPYFEVHHNDGNGTFVAHQQDYLSSIFRTAFADTDNDGDLDLITPGSVWLNRVPFLLTGLSPARNARSVSPSADVAFTFNQPLSSTIPQSTVRVFSQQAGGRKAGTTTVSGNTLRFDPSMDFKPGEAVFATQTRSVRSLDGQTDGYRVFQFTTATKPSAAQFSNGPDVPLNNPYSLATGDVDGDGDLDLLSATQGAPGTSNTVSVRLNTGSGTFTNGQEVTVSSLGKILLGDMDADGDLDLVTSNGVHLNGGNGVFGTAQQPGIGGTALGDLNADGNLDLLADSLLFNPNTSTYSTIVRIRLNQGNGTFTRNAQVPLTALGAISIALGDVNNDGVLDLLAAGSSNGLVTVRLGDGSGGVFATRPDISVSTMPNGLTLSDADGDGDLDLFATNSGSTVTVLLNDGQGNFGSPRYVNLGSYSVFTGVGDVDGDGDLDLLAGGFPNSVSVRLNDGLGNFGGSQSITVNDSPRALTLGDLDGDGTLDFATANASGSASIRLNNKVLANAPAQLTEQVSLYPNPARSSVRVQLPAALAGRGVQLRVLNTLGQEVLKQSLASQASEEVSLLRLSAGAYIVQLRTPRGLINKRLLVE